MDELEIRLYHNAPMQSRSFYLCDKSNRCLIVHFLKSIQLDGNDECHYRVRLTKRWTPDDGKASRDVWLPRATIFPRQGGIVGALASL